MNNSLKNETKGEPLIYSLSKGEKGADWQIVTKNLIKNEQIRNIDKKLSIKGVSTKSQKIDDKKLICIYRFPTDLSYQSYWKTALRNLLVIEKEIGEIASIEDYSRKNWKTRFAILEMEGGLEIDKTFLMELVLKKSTDDLEKYIKNASKKAINETTPSGRSALNYAILANQVTITEMLVDAGADVNIFGESTPLQDAVFSDIELTKLLIRSNADIDLQNRYGETPLMIASGCGNEQIVEFLLEKGANPTIKDVGGETALTKAIKNGHSKVIEVLSEI